MADGAANPWGGAGDGERRFLVYVKASAGGVREPIEVEEGWGVREMKLALHNEHGDKFGCEPERMRLIYKGRVLEDARTLGSYGLQAEHTVHLVKSPVTGGAASRPAAGTAAGTAAGGAAAAAPPRNPFAPAGGLEDILSATNSPAMQSFLENPEIIRSVISSNPELRSLLDTHPELNHLLNDPSTLRQAMQLARNPELMREQMRSTDRAMANIEGHPEGFNMLRRMYENVQEPLMNATADGARRAGQHGTAGDPDNPFASLFAGAGGAAAQGGADAQPNTEPLPNPWAAPEARPRRGAPPALGAAAAGQPLASEFPGAAAAFPGAAAGGTDAAARQHLEMLENPGFRSMMQTMMSNPAMMESLMSADPRMRRMLEEAPHLREVLQDPAFLETISNPDTMRSMMNIQREMQQLMGGGGGGGGPFGGMGGMMGEGGQAPAGLEQLLGAMGAAGGAPPAAPAPVANPEEAYARQLQQLQDMGFYDREENLRALQAAHGNVNAAVERLLSGA